MTLSKTASLSVVILAAGQGKRMCSDLPKVLHPLLSLPLIQYVLNAAKSLAPQRIIIVHAADSSALKTALSHETSLQWAEQSEPRGTGDALKAALPLIDTEYCLVLNGDVPLLSSASLQSLYETTIQQADNAIGLLTAALEQPCGYGRIVRDSNQLISKIIEEKDATAEQKQINEVNTGVFVFAKDFLTNNIGQLNTKNKQGEYYLTDLLEIAIQNQLAVQTVKIGNGEEILGINTRLDLTKVERVLLKQRAQQLIESGVVIADINRIDLRGPDIQIDSDSFIDINVILEGQVKIGKNCNIGPGVIIKNSEIADNVHIKAYSVIEEATIENDVQIGPCAHLRPGTVLKSDSKVGNFVEIKKAVLGPGSKANHLSYIGDSDIGSKVNIGAGVITCNYDGVNKHQTIIEDNAFVGSNCALVAPVKVGANATVAAGTILTKPAPSDQLTISRSKQYSVSWSRPQKKSK